MTHSCKLARCVGNVILKETWNPTTQQVEQEKNCSTTSGLTPLVIVSSIKIKKKPKNGGYSPD